MKGIKLAQQDEDWMIEPGTGCLVFATSQLTARRRVLSEKPQHPESITQWIQEVKQMKHKAYHSTSDRKCEELHSDAFL